MAKAPETPTFAKLADDALGQPAPALPTFATFQDRAVVIVEIADYREMRLAQARALSTPLPRRTRPPRREPRRALSTVEKDAEVAEFLKARFPHREAIAALHADCLAKFGPERSPSIGRLATFRKRWRDYR